MEQAHCTKCYSLGCVGGGGETFVSGIFRDRLGEVETDFIEVDNLTERNDFIDSNLVVLENTNHTVDEGLVVLDDMLLLAFTEELLAGDIDIEIDQLSIEFANRLFVDMNG